MGVNFIVVVVTISLNCPFDVTTCTEACRLDKMNEISDERIYEGIESILLTSLSVSMTLTDGI